MTALRSEPEHPHTRGHRPRRRPRPKSRRDDLAVLVARVAAELARPAAVEPSRIW